MSLSASVGFFLIFKARENNSAFAPKNMFFSITFFIIPILSSRVYTFILNLSPSHFGGGVWGEVNLNFKTITLPICLYHAFFAFFAFYALAMFHTENAFIFTAIDIFKNIFKVDLSGCRLIASRCIPQMESGYLTPGSFNIWDQVSFSDLLMINIVNYLAYGPVNCSAN